MTTDPALDAHAVEILRVLRGMLWGERYGDEIVSVEHLAIRWDADGAAAIVLTGRDRPDRHPFELAIPLQEELKSQPPRDVALDILDKLEDV